METLQYEPERQALIRRSHERCLALGLGDSEHPDYGLLPRSELSEALERDRLLLHHARPVMQRLHGHVAETRGMVILTDAQGLVMHTLGEGDFLERAQRIALSQGALWSESLKGTNAIGTAIVERRPTVVHANEHFVRAHHFITCAATPIQDSTGRLLGVLDVTGDQRGYREHTIALVRMSATTIENTLIGAGLREGISLRLHARPELIGTVAEGILAFDPCGKLVAANAAAREMLGGDARRMSTECVASLFGFGYSVLADRVREAEGRPLLLRLRDEAAVFAVGELREPADAQPTHVRTPGGVLTPETFGAFAQAVAARRAAEDAGMEAPDARHEAEPVAAPSPAAHCAPAEPRAAPREAPRGGALDALDTGDARLAQLLAQLRRVLDRDIPILVLGETGTGKELLARAIHADSRRASGPFVAVNCAAIPETLIESELFGYEEGAFTGARRKGATGRIQQAHRGTLFLDEIGDMPPSLQARLLRVLQERAVSPLGGTRSVPVDVAVVCATHRNVRELIDTGRFREDLYYRVNGLTVRLPPLRDRQDLPRIVQRILDTELQGAGPGRVAPDAMMLLQRHRWPGNIRQLANVLRTACALAGDEPTITASHLPEAFMDELQAPSTSCAYTHIVEGDANPVPPSAGRFAMPPARAEAPGGLDLAGHELALIRQALAACGGNVSLAARQLGISRNTIYRKLRATGD